MVLRSFFPGNVFIHHRYYFSLNFPLYSKQEVAKKQYALDKLCQVCYNFVQVGDGRKEANSRGRPGKGQNPHYSGVLGQIGIWKKKLSFFCYWH